MGRTEREDERRWNVGAARPVTSAGRLIRLSTQAALLDGGKFIDADRMDFKRVVRSSTIAKVTCGGDNRLSETWLILDFELGAVRVFAAFRAQSATSAGTLCRSVETHSKQELVLEVALCQMFQSS